MPSQEIVVQYSETSNKDHVRVKTTLLLRPQIRRRVFYFQCIFHLCNETTHLLRPPFFWPNHPGDLAAMQCTSRQHCADYHIVTVQNLWLSVIPTLFLFFLSHPSWSMDNLFSIVCITVLPCSPFFFAVRTLVMGHEILDKNLCKYIFFLCSKANRITFFCTRILG